MKHLELNFFAYYTVDAKRPKKLVKDALHFFLYIINLMKYCTFQLRALCVRARTMQRLTERKNRWTCALELSPLFLVFPPFDFQNGGGLIRI